MVLVKTRSNLDGDSVVCLLARLVGELAFTSQPRRHTHLFKCTAGVPSDKVGRHRHRASDGLVGKTFEDPQHQHCSLSRCEVEQRLPHVGNAGSVGRNAELVGKLERRVSPRPDAPPSGATVGRQQAPFGGLRRIPRPSDARPDPVQPREGVHDDLVSLCAVAREEISHLSQPKHMAFGEDYEVGGWVRRHRSRVTDSHVTDLSLPNDGQQDVRCEAPNARTRGQVPR